MAKRGSLEIEGTGFNTSSLVPAGVSEFTLPDELIALGEAFKF